MNRIRRTERKDKTWGQNGDDCHLITHQGHRSKRPYDSHKRHRCRNKHTSLASEREVISDEYYYENGTVVGAFSSQISSLSMIDGSSIMVLVNSGSCTNARGPGKHLSNICAWVFVDLNGKNAPNTMGRDVFGFYLTKYGFIPDGTKDETRYDFKHSTGHGRTAWVIYNENLDYLKCPDKLDWDGKTSCK